MNADEAAGVEAVVTILLTVVSLTLFLAVFAFGAHPNLFFMGASTGATLINAIHYWIRRSVKP